MSAAGAGAGAEPKIGHWRIRIGAFAARKYLCPGKAGFEWDWVWVFFLFILKDVLKITRNEAQGRVGTGWDCLPSLSTGFYPPGRRGTRLNQPVWGQNERLCWLFWEGRGKAGPSARGPSRSAGSCKGGMQEEAGCRIPALGAGAASPQGTTNIFHFYIDVVRVNVCNGGGGGGVGPINSLFWHPHQHLCKMKEGARWD